MAKRKKGRRGNNEGSIRRRKDGTWEGRVTVGYDDEGKPIRKSFYGKDRETVAQKINQALNKVYTSSYFEPSRATIKEWLQEWLKGRKAHIAESTHSTYETMIKVHIAPTIGSIKIKDIKTREIQNLLNEKLAGGLSARTVKYIYQTINAGLRQAVKERLIYYNPAEHVELPKQESKEMRTFTVEELKRFFEVAKDSPHYTAYYLDLATGLRRGELLGLRWKDIDLEKETLSVWQQLVKSREKPRLKLKETKTPKSKRTVKLDPATIALLKFHKKRQEKLRESLGEYCSKVNPDGYQDQDLVFCIGNGKPIDPDNFRRHFNLILEKAELPRARIHDLRHTYATLALEAGVDIKTLQESLGHTSIAITGDIYGHVTDRMREEAASKVGGVLAGCQNTTPVLPQMG